MVLQRLLERKLNILIAIFRTLGSTTKNMAGQVRLKPFYYFLKCQCNEKSFL